MAGMNGFQKAAAQKYEGGDYAHITSARASAKVGDTLFTFIISELSDDGEKMDRGEAIRRMQRARDSLDSVLVALYLPTDVDAAELARRAADERGWGENCDEPRFYVVWGEGETDEVAETSNGVPLSELLWRNTDDAEFCAWLMLARVGCSRKVGGGAAPLVTTTRVS